MTTSTPELRRLKEEKYRRLQKRTSPYRYEPVRYAEEVLNVRWWSVQAQIAQALIEHKRVFVRAGNGPGKSFLAAGLVNWYYDVHNPGLCLTTAPTQAQVQDVLWKEIRAQRKGRSGLQPKAPRMEDGPDHFAVGYTASTADSFQGRHAEHLFIIFDEATGVDAPFWTAAEGMQPEYWLVLLNPTDTATRAYEEEISGNWHVINLNSFEHPNILAEQSGLPAPYPQSSLHLSWLRDRVREWCTPIPKEDKRAADFAFEGGVYRPGPLFEARVLGMWPTVGSSSVWNEAIWNACLTPQEIPDAAPLTIGCDVARFGDDFTTILARRGPCAIHHETHNGWSTEQTAGRLKQLCKQFAAKGEDPTRVVCNIDDDGVGGGVVDQKGDHTFRPVSGANKSLSGEYPNKRSEAWFAVAEMADEGNVDLSRLPLSARSLLRRQVMAPLWKLDAQGRRVVEPKADTKKRIGRSPDDADALNLAYAPSTRVIKLLKW